MSDKEARTPESALQRLTEAGEIQAALERVAVLEAALLDMANLWVSVCNPRGWEPEHVVQYTAARAALAGEATAAPRLTDAELRSILPCRVSKGEKANTWNLFTSELLAMFRDVETKVRGTT